ncbi:MAG TPA: PaaI family thioesterase [Ktedonobacterales bacterium]|nr:PaaI family thioesterase [Ktedonobacterales bacterium]
MTEEQAGAADAGTSSVNDRLNDNSAYQQCFACGQRNDIGLRLVFRREDEAIVTEYTPDARYQGFPGIVHGGVIATLLDETMSRTAMIEGRWMMTGRLEVRYRTAAPAGQTLRVTARTLSSRSRMITATAEVRLADEPETLIATGEAVFLPIPAAFREQSVEQYPELAGFFDI